MTILPLSIAFEISKKSLSISGASFVRVALTYNTLSLNVSHTS
jgi:hypothetical protein